MITNGVFVEGIDKGSMMEPCGQPTFTLKGHDGLAYRNAADPQGLGDGVLRQARAGPELSLEDQLPDVDCRLFSATAEGHWSGNFSLGQGGLCGHWVFRSDSSDV